MKEKVRRIIRTVTFTLLSLYCLYSVYFFVVNPIHPEYLDCGIVQSKSADEIAIKHGSRTELYLNIQFKKSGFKSINVTPTTYFSSKKGDYICFDLNKETDGWYTLFSASGAIILFIIGIILIICFVYYLTGPHKEEE